MKIRLLNILVIILLLGCAKLPMEFEEREILRLPAGTPERFNAPKGMILHSDTCHRVLYDPEDGTEIHLQDFRDNVADYEDVSRKYLLGENELLRIDCSTGEVLGVVER